MDINRLHEFITLATLLNYRKAATQLYLTQPALSRHIHDLENTVGAPLFVRDTHSVALTSIGELFFDEAKAIYDRYEHALTLIKEATSTTTGELRIGFLGTASQNFFADFVTSFTAAHPEISLSLHCGYMDALINRLNAGDSDVGVVTLNTSHIAGLEYLEIKTFPLFAVMHPSHPYASRKSLPLLDLSGLPFINFSEQAHPAAADFNRQLFQKGGARCLVTEEVSFIEEGIFQASINKGVFFLPEYLLCMVPHTLSVIPLEEEYCKTTLSLLWKKSNSNPALLHFINEFRSYIKNHRQNLLQEYHADADGEPFPAFSDT